MNARLQLTAHLRLY